MVLLKRALLPGRSESAMSLNEPIAESALQGLVYSAKWNIAHAEVQTVSSCIGPLLQGFVIASG